MEDVEYLDAQKFLISKKGSGLAGIVDGDDPDEDIWTSGIALVLSAGEEGGLGTARWGVCLW